MKQTTVEWAPKNGERVWVKVFSNWSLGTYIGFDAIENVHLVREDASGGGSLMSSSLVLPESTNPNVPKQLTAVEWLFEQLENHNGVTRAGFEKCIQEAKEMEKEQIKNAYDEGVWDVGCKAPNFDEYYKRTFKSE
jgi:hypothetical protein